MPNGINLQFLKEKKYLELETKIVKEMELRKQAKEESIKVIRLDFQVIELSSQCSYIFVLDPVRHACSFCMPFGIDGKGWLL